MGLNWGIYDLEVAARNNMNTACRYCCRRSTCKPCGALGVETCRNFRPYVLGRREQGNRQREMGLTQQPQHDLKD